MESFGLVGAAVFCLLMAAEFQFCQGAEWSYEGTKDGVAKWPTMYPGECDGKRQSPIDLNSPDVMYDTKLEPFKFNNFDQVNGVSMQLGNNGHTVQVTYLGGTLEVKDGGLDGKYQVVQFHFHWGSDNTKGSEHTVDGVSCPMEVHIVCYNTKYADLASAVKNTDGLAVLGFFFELSNDINPTMQTIVNDLPTVMYPGNSTVISPFALTNLMAEVKDFYRYDGGLTTPHCNEVVTWTMFKDTIKISSAQMAAFRTLLDVDQQAMVNNFRPVQKLYTRAIRASFYDEKFASASGSLVFSSLALVSSLVVSLWLRA